jgi:hypothetical protein
MASETLYRVIAPRLVLIAVAVAANHVGTIPELGLPTGAQLVAGLATGLGIGIVAALTESPAAGRSHVRSCAVRLGEGPGGAFPLQRRSLRLKRLRSGDYCCFLRPPESC